MLATRTPSARPGQARPAVRIVPPEGGERLVVLGAPVTLKSDGAHGAMLFADHIVPPGYGVPMHIHHGEDEICYVLEGEIVFGGQSGETAVGPGTFVHLPRGAAHAFRNASGKPARMLVVCSPAEDHGGALDGVFRDLDRAAKEAPASLTPARVGEITARHDVWLV
jgi:mannose-6-phosphate isomerase-like protein (cupin superfamily)